MVHTGGMSVERTSSQCMPLAIAMQIVYLHTAYEYSGDNFAWHFLSGMPYPQNLVTARDVEAIVKKNGATPATIAILDGVPCIGLDNEQLVRLAKLGSNARKTSRRDIPYIIAAGENGATTVSATMFFASKVGIPVFVTGGIGGVHRHGEQTMDISSDLTELGRTPVAVISAGVKSILDIPKTLEYLETQGVTVIAYRTNEFPAFFTETSGCQVPSRLDSPEECARLISRTQLKIDFLYVISHDISSSSSLVLSADANLNVGLGSGMLIAVPIPKEHAAYGHIIETAIQKALKEAMDNHVIGNAVTPFLLSRVNELTVGASLAANIALVKNNAYVGAKIAVALAHLRQNVPSASLTLSNAEETEVIPLEDPVNCHMVRSS
ncbi:hypothetical protein KSP39_PZI022137 [Platanthera zijinensis]|uniref:Pseudouridine-5'-phosphate glycosidase n=1 Tax=Platanthera zijinensis TaxID=2320716 RepID=A0AAP0FVD9_9ASPA